ncbi:MAG: hypothetical protein KKA81_06970 [Bacteroidetes bacterium]|nr:hypothetical protein [Bacteroidota bacterium]
MILSIETWWQAMETAEKVYWLIALPFTLIFLIMLVMTFIGGDFEATASDGDPDMTVGTDEGIGFQFISIKNLMAFFTIFGWTGIFCLSAGWSLGLTILISSLAGLLMMLIMASLIYYLGKLGEDGTLKLQNAVGKIGTVYLTIPPSRKGMGKVQIRVQGFQTLDAITDETESIPTGSVIVVTGVINDDALLVKVSR